MLTAEVAVCCEVDELSEEAVEDPDDAALRYVFRGHDGRYGMISGRMRRKSFRVVPMRIA